jgi:hypothetical protein
MPTPFRRRWWCFVLSADKTEVGQCLRQRSDAAVADLFFFFADKTAFALRRLFLL